MTARTSVIAGAPLRGWLVLAAVAFAANLSWEVAHGSLYTCELSAVRYLRATGGDVALVVAAVWSARRLVGTTPAPFWATLVGLLGGAAVAIELVALGTGYWSYTCAMPTVGPIGVSPLAQLPVTAAAATAAAHRVDSRFRAPSWSP